MTHDAELATSEAEARPARRKPDLLGFAYLATLGVVMIIWLGGLIWAVIAMFEWVIS